MAHRQTLTRINVAVDEGIAELIAALSSFPQLQTIESCQKIADGSAWVCFLYGFHWDHSWRDLAVFAFDVLGPKLARDLGDKTELVLRVSSVGTVVAELTVRPGALPEAIQSIEQLRAELGDQGLP